MHSFQPNPNRAIEDAEPSEPFLGGLVDEYQG